MVPKTLQLAFLQFVQATPPVGREKIYRVSDDSVGANHKTDT